MTATAEAVRFGADQLLANAKAYYEHRAIVNAASKYDSLDDALAALKAVWGDLENQSRDGSGYTPDTALNFGSSNAAEIADQILGRGPTVAATRKALAAMGK
ncbi:hypothetical protein LCGC14_1952650 [marine sediment metagenome]|uniref:Uncharacterized protein n=1 Tax=marine sediment metagenome TaxID=412755 RepID=A0A0F9HVD9_9ZZZZ